MLVLLQGSMPLVAQRQQPHQAHLPLFLRRLPLHHPLPALDGPLLLPLGLVQLGPPHQQLELPASKLLSPSRSPILIPIRRQQVSPIERQGALVEQGVLAVPCRQSCLLEGADIEPERFWGREQELLALQPQIAHGPALRLQYVPEQVEGAMEVVGCSLGT